MINPTKLKEVIRLYNPYFQPFQPVQPMNFGSYPQKYEIIHVSGKAGAEAFKMLPNSNALLLDDTQPIVWLSKTDGTGIHTLIPYDIKEHVEEAKSEYSTLEQRLNELERRLSIYESNSSAFIEQISNQSADISTSKADSEFTESAKAIANEYDRKSKSKRSVSAEMQGNEH